MKQIIVAIDFSSPSKHAANYAADLAATLHLNITLVHVVEIP
jgi:nucleotide-binding universal stress UspA family protein